MSGRLRYPDVVATLEGALTFGIHPSLDTIRALTEALGRPQDAFACVQVGGTNGKSSVTRMTAAILRAHGLRTGCYTSPHLLSYTERIEIGGTPIAEETFAAAIEAALDAAEAAVAADTLDSDTPVTEFELLTAAALWAFRDAGVDFAVLEVGMGGRWDATSVVSAVVAVVTGVALDHIAHLGRTRVEIAADKAHIIVPASAPVLGPGTAGVEDAFLERAELMQTHARAVRARGEASPVAEEMTARFEVVSAPTAVGAPLGVAVAGLHAGYGVVEIIAPAYQAPNIATAVAAAEAAIGRALDPAALAAAFADLTTPGRFQVVGTAPPVVLDAAHNPEAAQVLSVAVRGVWGGQGAPTVLLGVLTDKDAAGIVTALAPVAGRFAVTASASSRAIPADDLADVVRQVTGDEPAVYQDVGSALAGVLPAGPEGLLVTGSITVVGETLAVLLSNASF